MRELLEDDELILQPLTALD